jgi:hypothetical protein
MRAAGLDARIDWLDRDMAVLVGDQPIATA